VDFIQKFRDLLNLVNDHPIVEVGWNSLRESGGPGQEVIEQVSFKEIEVKGLRKGLLDPTGLARSPRAKEKEALRLRGPKKSGIHTSSLHGNMEVAIPISLDQIPRKKA
jgi:hypothetical protein